MRISKNLHWLVCILFFISCARQSSPTGGPKDTIPPKLIRTVPGQEAINFKGQQIELVFSEMIILNNPKEQLIITPTVGKDFDLKIKKNTIILDLDKPLEDNTTYTFNFREAVQDITEKNPAKSLQLAFSTGPYIDSLFISGNVFDLIKNVEAKEATVAIYHQGDTFNLLKHPATYFTKSTQKGAYKIEHLKPGIYFIYAFEDKNRNLILDTKNESYGFLASPIHLTKDTSKVSVAMLKLDARPLKLTNARPYNTYFNIRTSKNVKAFTLKARDNKDIYYSYGPDQSNIQVYNTFKDQDSVALSLNATDSIGNTIDTLLYAKFQTREVEPEKFKVSLKDATIIASKALLEASYTFTKPLKEVNFDSLYFQVDSLTNVPINKEDLTYDETLKTLTIKKKLDRTLFKAPDENPDATPAKKDTSSTPALKRLHILYSGKGSFLSVEGDSSQAIEKSIQPLKASDLSQIEFQLRINHPHFIVQLLDKEFTIISQIANQKKGIFADLPAGDYQLRVVIDRNQNGVWDAGNIIKREEPEPIIYSKDDSKSQIIKLRANYEIVLPILLITS